MYQYDDNRNTARCPYDVYVLREERGVVLCATEPGKRKVVRRTPRRRRNNWTLAEREGRQGEEGNGRQSEPQGIDGKKEEWGFGEKEKGERDSMVWV
jgi:hypothetical protein